MGIQKREKKVVPAGGWLQAFEGHAVFPEPISGTRSQWWQVVLASLPRPGASQAGRLRNHTCRMFKRESLNIDMPVFETTIPMYFI